MSSHPVHHYDAATLALLHRALEGAWVKLKETDNPAGSDENRITTRYMMAKSMLHLAATGERDFDALVRQALRGVLAG